MVRQALTKKEYLGYNILRFMPKWMRFHLIERIVSSRRKRLYSLKTPECVELFITNKCNAKCKHCFYSVELNAPKEEMSLEDMEKLARSFKHPLRTLVVTGGEPFLRSDIVEICELFVKYNKTKRISIATNGAFPDLIYKKIRKIKDFGMDLHVQISLDGKKETHDRIRGLQIFDNACKTIKLLKSLDIDLTILTTVTNDNFKEIKSFSKEFSEMFPGVLHKYNVLRGSHLGNFGVPNGELDDLDPPKSKSLTTDEQKKLFEEVYKNINPDSVWAITQKRKIGIALDILENKKKRLDCFTGYAMMVVYANGDVTICDNRKPFANLKKYDYDMYKLCSAKETRELIESKKCFCCLPGRILYGIGHDAKEISNVVEESLNKD
jgi:MoaA/NifB/PqqE/SkfB family radical SAM enzyme